MLKRVLLSILLLSLSISVFSLAQDSCDLDSVNDYLSRGDTAYYAGDYEAALIDYNCAITLAPDDAQPYLYRGVAYYAMGLYSQAIEDFTRAGELDPEEFLVYYNLGISYYWTGDYEQALDNLSHALELDATYSDARLSRAAIYLEQGNYEEGLADINLIIEEDSDYEYAYLLRAWAYIYMGSGEIPHADFLKWLELTETDTVEQSLSEALADDSLSVIEGTVYRLSFEGEAGQSFEAAATSDDVVDPLLVLLAPDGTVLISDDDGGVNLNAVISHYSLPETGAYTLLLGQSASYGTGEIELSVMQGESLISTNGSVASGEVSENSEFVQYNLYLGDTAEIFTTAGDRLNLRSGPGLDYEIVDRLEYGETVTLLEGPRKEGGYSWWRIRTADGQEGWAVERVETEQTLQLALFTGEEALVVTADEKLNVRANPARDAELLFQLEDGVHVTLLDDEPVVVDGLRWWHIRTADGQEGWAIDRIGIERTLAPAREFPNR
jgi:tetratricopeptide (TPR) repeat protein/SH3-like domain-containing protein